MAQRIIIDCDPGQDDAVALFLAFACPDELDVLGITTVGGNVPLELTYRNARLMCDIAKSNVPVFAGCAEPMSRPLRTAEMIHGKTGINGIDVFDFCVGRPLMNHRRQKSHAHDAGDQCSR